MNPKYEIASNIRTLQEWAEKGYEFVAVIDPDRWLIVKMDDEPVEEDEAEAEVMPKFTTVTNSDVLPTFAPGTKEADAVEIISKVPKKDGQRTNKKE